MALHRSFYNTLPTLTQVPRDEADIAWLVYDLQLDTNINRYNLILAHTIYTKFEAALLKITQSEAGDVSRFTNFLQAKLDEKLEVAPDAPTLGDITLG